MFESWNSAGAIEKLPSTGKPDANISSWSCDMEGHAKKCVERYCELANTTTHQFFKVATPCIDDHQFKEEEMGSVGELSKVCSQIVLKCLYLVRIGKPDTSWSVNKLARAITKWTRACDKRSARLISYIHSWDMWIQTILSCGKYSTSMQIRIVSRFWFRRRPWRLKINIRWTLVHFRKSHVCSNKLDVQETDFSFTRLYRSWSNFSRCRFTHGRNSSSWSLGFGYRSVSFFPKPTQQHHRETCRVIPHHTSTPTTKPRFQPSTSILLWTMLIVCRRTRSFLELVRSLRITKPWLKWSSKAEVQRWDTCPEPTELLLIGCLTELIWIPKFQSSMSTPNTN